MHILLAFIGEDVAELAPLHRLCGDPKIEHIYYIVWIRPIF